LEAFQAGVPVIASALGSFPEIVEDHKTGLLFKPANPHDLAEKIQWILAHDTELHAMGEHVRRQYREKYSGRRNYEILKAVYQKAMQGPGRQETSTGKTHANG
jgi:glycosyltransferase involved in cell wall biosynthesis